LAKVIVFYETALGIETASFFCFYIWQKKIQCKARPLGNAIKKATPISAAFFLFKNILYN